MHLGYCPAMKFRLQMGSLHIRRPNWVVLLLGYDCPKSDGLPEWHGKYHDPVVRLVLALYGHPDAGGFWEQHCEKALRSVGFEQCPDWKSVFRHPKLNLMLVVYVDDFKLSGPKANLAQGWSLMASKIKLEPPLQHQTISWLRACDVRILLRVLLIPDHTGLVLRSQRRLFPSSPSVPTRLRCRRDPLALARFA